MDNTARASTCEPHTINRSLRRLMTPAPVFELHGQGQERERVEAYIAARFHDAHGAVIRTFLPHLLAIRYPTGYHAALGIRPATEEALFVEQYLDIPAEQLIAGASRSPIHRSNIVEIGNLVSTQSGTTALLFLILLGTIHHAGFQHVIFTATPQVIRAIDKLGFAVQPLCPADPARLREGADAWGSYYSNRPQVVVGFVAQSMQICTGHRLMDTILCMCEERVRHFARQLRNGI